MMPAIPNNYERLRRLGMLADQPRLSTHGLPAPLHIVYDEPNRPMGVPVERPASAERENGPSTGVRDGAMSTLALPALLRLPTVRVITRWWRRVITERARVRYLAWPRIPRRHPQVRTFGWRERAQRRAERALARIAREV